MTQPLRTSPAAAITRSISVCLALPLLSLLLPGCQSWHKTHESALTAWASGNTDVSVARLQEARSQFRSEKELLDLDLAMLELAVGQPAAAETLFRKKRESLSFLSQKDIGEQTASILTDSRAIAWSGRDFERSMLLNLAMLSSMVSDGQDSFAYSHQFTKAAADRRELIAAALQKKQRTANRPTANWSTANWPTNIHSKQPMTQRGSLASATRPKTPPSPSPPHPSINRLLSARG